MIYLELIELAVIWGAFGLVHYLSTRLATRALVGQIKGIDDEVTDCWRELSSIAGHLKAIEGKIEDHLLLIGNNFLQVSQETRGLKKLIDKLNPPRSNKR